MVVDTSAYMEQSWLSLYTSCIYPALTYLETRHKAADASLQVRTDFALVCFCDHAPYGDRLLRTFYFTSKLSQFNEWAKSLTFYGGGYAQNAVCEGLSAAVQLLQSGENKSVEQYILLASNSAVRALDTPCKLAQQEGTSVNIYV